MSWRISKERRFELGSYILFHKFMSMVSEQNLHRGNNNLKHMNLLENWVQDFHNIFQKDNWSNLCWLCFQEQMSISQTGMELEG